MWLKLRLKIKEVVTRLADHFSFKLNVHVVEFSSFDGTGLV